MILVDSSVWIDYFNGKENSQTDFLDQSLGRQLVSTGDLILAEVLQGFKSKRDFEVALSLFEKLVFHQIGGKEIAIKVAENHRLLRKKGITVRKTIDLFIATYCIENDLRLLHNDRDFDSCVKYLELKIALV